MEKVISRIDDQKNSAAIVCPGCHKTTEISAASLGAKHHLKVRCACRNVFLVEIEFRDKSRQRVDFPGFYEIIKNPAGRGNNQPSSTWQNDRLTKTPPNCLVIDLSKNGVGFITLDEQEVKIGDFINLHFRLNDNLGSRINSPGLVKHINDNFIGCRILQANAALGFFLLGRK